MCLAAFFLDGLPAVVAGGEDGHLYVLDVPTLDTSALACSSSAHTAPVSAVLPMMDGGETTFVSGDADGTVRRWTAVPCEPVGDPVVAGPGEITALCRTGGRLLRAGAPNRITVVGPDLRDLDELFVGPPSPAALAVVRGGVGQPPGVRTHRYRQPPDLRRGVVRPDRADSRRRVRLPVLRWWSAVPRWSCEAKAAI